MKKIIYDLGANNGDDIPYYLMKADVVVAVEANPALCATIHEHFAAEVRAGRLAVENCVITAEGAGGPIDFYVHRSNHVLSQLPPPPPKTAADFDKVILPSKNISDIVRAHGDPYYVKIDIEHYDAQILRALFAAGVVPPYISAESHSVEVFAVLVALGGYDAFKMVDGHTVSQVYANRRIARDGQGAAVTYSFPYHSAGPFGDDVDGPWLTASNFLRVLALEGLGWKDIHATNTTVAAPAALRHRDWVLRYLSRTTGTKSRMIASKWLRALGLRRR